MDLPALEAGMAILASQINNISREVRSNAITAVTGGNFVRSTGGTSITIDPGTQGDATLPCPFKVTGGQEPLDINIAFGRLQPSQTIPSGMGYGPPPSYTPYGVTLSVTEDSFIYMRSEFDETYITLKKIEFVVETEMQSNTTTMVYSLQAIVRIEDGFITSIDNTCQNADPSNCYLDWSVA